MIHRVGLVGLSLAVACGRRLARPWRPLTAEHGVVGAAARYAWRGTGLVMLAYLLVSIAGSPVR